MVNLHSECRINTFVCTAFWNLIIKKLLSYAKGLKNLKLNELGGTWMQYVARRQHREKSVSQGNIIFVVTDFIQWFFKTDFSNLGELPETRRHSPCGWRNHWIPSSRICILTPFPPALSQSGESRPGSATSSLSVNNVRGLRERWSHLLQHQLFFSNCPEILERKQASVLTEELSVNSHFSHELIKNWNY